MRLYLLLKKICEHIKQLHAHGYDLETAVISKDNVKVAANSLGELTIPMTSYIDQGYIPVAIAGFDTDNATTGGGYSSYISYAAVFIDSSQNIVLQYRNHSSKQAVARFEITVLFKKKW